MPRIDWYERLRALRAKAWKTGRNAVTSATILTALLLLSGGLWFLASVVQFLMIAAPSHYGGADEFASAALMLVISSVLPLSLIAYCITLLMVIPWIYRYHYRKAWRYLIHTWWSRLLVDEELHRILQQQVTRGSFTLTMHKTMPRTFEQQLDYCVCHLTSLQQLADNPERRLNWRQLNYSQLLYSRGGMFAMETTGWCVAGCLLSAVVGGLAWILAMYVLSLSLQFIPTRAKLAALADYLLEDPQIDIANLPPPDNFKLTWLQELIAPLEEKRRQTLAAQSNHPHM